MFSKFLVIDTSQLAREVQILGVCCEFKVWFIFCRCNRSAVCHIVIINSFIMDLDITTVLALAGIEYTDIILYLSLFILTVKLSIRIGLVYKQIHTLATNYRQFQVLSWTLQWRHDECDGVSNHRRFGCLLNRFTGADQRKNQSSASLAFVTGIHRWPVDYPHKGPITRKRFPFDDVTMENLTIVRWHWYNCHIHTVDKYCLSNGSLPHFNILRPRQDNGRHFADDILNAFSRVKML